MDRGHRTPVARPTGLLGPASPRASRLYRAILLALRLVGRGVFGFRPELVGGEHLPKDPDGRPAGGWIGAGLPHRTWVDPFVIADLLPVEPRLAFLGDGRAMFRSRWRRLVFGRIGGVIPIWPGGRRDAVEAHLAGVRAVVEAGGVLVLFPEVGSPAPLGEARRLGLGVAYFALRTGAPIVPLVLGGTEELYRARRLRLEVLPAVSGRDLAGLGPDGPLPEAWSAEERAMARRIVERLHELTAPAVAAAHAATAPPAGTRKRWRWLTTAWR